MLVPHQPRALPEESIMPRSVELPLSWRRHWRALAIALLWAAAGLSQAQSGTGDRADPPSRVARLSYIAGDLAFLPAGAKDWSDANINRPLTTGDRLSTAADARAELEFGGGTLHIDGRSDFGLLDLNDDLAQLELTRGTVSLTARRLGDGQSYEIDTPAVALVIDQPGTFRVDVDPRDGSTDITAFEGSATVFGENNAQRSIDPGRSYHFVDSSLGMVTITDIGGRDGFDRWANDRDRRYTQSTSTRYVSDEMVGYQDLDQYGGWQDTSEYGAVWFPRDIGPNWAPYRNGHWTYIAPWGWTWVDDAPWGFAPYHYGRWAYMRGGWGWIPGPRDMRPIYAPALVAFVGGGGWSVGYSSAPVGWFPLGPGEIYNPWYRSNRTYYVNINIHNIRHHHGHDPRRDIDNHYNRYRRGHANRGDHYANRGAPRGFTAVSGRDFASGRHVQRDLIDVDARRLADAPVLTRGIDRVRPVHDGIRPPRNAHARDLPAGGFDRTVVARRAPPAARQDPAAGTQDRVRPPTARSNVRVLDNEVRADRRGRTFPTNRGDDAPNRPDAGEARPPVAPRITSATPGSRPNSTPDGNELRSARFAHPRGRDIRPQQPDRSPRRDMVPPAGNHAPSVTADHVAQPRAPQSETVRTPAWSPGNDRVARPQPDRRMRRVLPESDVMIERESAAQPRFERAPRARTAPSRFERPQSEPVEQPRFDRPQSRPAEQPRFQRPDRRPREVANEAHRSMPTPQRSAPSPQSYPPQQRPAPAPRAEFQQPRRAESRPVNRKRGDATTVEP